MTVYAKQKNFRRSTRKPRINTKFTAPRLVKGIPPFDKEHVHMCRENTPTGPVWSYNHTVDCGHVVTV